jgi:hypothetical protein
LLASGESRTTVADQAAGEQRRRALARAGERLFRLLDDPRELPSALADRGRQPDEPLAGLRDSKTVPSGNLADAATDPKL